MGKKKIDLSDIKINDLDETSSSTDLMTKKEKLNRNKSDDIDDMINEKRRTTEELAKQFIDSLSKFIPEITQETVEVYDVATPLTYERYCSSYQVSWMSIWKPKKPRFQYPQTIKNLEGVYFAGQRIMMPGGLPIAVYTGRRAVQLLCRDNKIEFV